MKSIDRDIRINAHETFQEKMRQTDSEKEEEDKKNNAKSKSVFRNIYILFILQTIYCNNIDERDKSDILTMGANSLRFPPRKRKSEREGKDESQRKK